jgi:hypothetical protein
LLVSSVAALIIATAPSSLSEAATAPAPAMTYDDIVGSWCGDSANPHWGNYLFAHDTVTITHLPGKKQTVLQVDRYEFTDKAVTLHYWAATGRGNIPGDKPFTVQFGHFGSDNKTMVQEPDDTRGKPYRYTRC